MPRRQNLGCGSLLLIFLGVALIGKFSPHYEKTSDGIPERRAANRSPSGVSSGAAGAHQTRPAALVGQKIPTKSMVSESSESNGIAGLLMKDLGDVLDDLIARFDESPVGLTSAASPRVNMTPLNGRPHSGKAGPSIAADGVSSDTSGWSESVSGAMGALMTFMPFDTRPSVPLDDPREKKSEPVAVSSGRPPVRERAGPSPVLAGQDPSGSVSGAVINSPWNGSVEQVERYLKRHMHDADSMEFIEWGAVRQTRQGYEVRCTFRSRNVLGKVATQSKNFMLTPEGEVSDIRD